MILKAPLIRKYAYFVFLFLLLVIIYIDASLLSVNIVPRAIDHALVQSGLIYYPVESVGKIFYTNSWNLETQLISAMLIVGIPFEFIRQIIIFIPLILIFFGLVIFFNAVLKNLNYINACIAFYMVILQLSLGGPDYPIGYISPHTFGIYPNAIAILLLGVYAGAYYKIFGFLLILAIAIHPVIGIVLITSFLFLILIEYIYYHAITVIELKEIKLGVLIATPIVLISLIYYFYLRININEVYEYDAYAAYLKYWDYHRTVVEYSYTYIKNIVIALFFLAGLFLFATVNKVAVRMLTFLTVLFFLFYLSKQMHPEWMVNLMFNRLTNLTSVVGFAIPSLFALVCMTNIYGYFMYNNIPAPFRRIGLFLHQNSSFYFNRKILILLLLLFFSQCLTFLKNQYPPLKLVDHFQNLLEARDGKINFQIFNSINSEVPQVSSIPSEVMEIINSGLVVTVNSTSRDTVLKARLPIMLDVSGIDFLPYMPSLTGEVKKIVVDIYGIDFFNPPEGIRNKGQLIDSFYKETFEGRNIGSWKEIGQKYKFCSVVVPADWKLKLKQIYIGDNYLIYYVPGYCDGAYKA